VKAEKGKNDLVQGIKLGAEQVPDGQAASVEAGVGAPPIIIQHQQRCSGFLV
jgi:hypothetical protein